MQPIERPEVIRAAGALLWSVCEEHRTLAVVHRKRYDDWTLPKGKLEAGESWQSAALREVKEETGFDARVLNFAGALSYEAKGKPKVVRYWHMLAQGEPATALDDEVDQVCWLTINKAVERLQYPLEKALLEQVSAPVGLLTGPRRPRFWWFEKTSLQRVGMTLDTFEPELEALLDDFRSTSTASYPNWYLKSKQLVELARHAQMEGDAERAWRCLKAADRFSLYGMEPDALSSEASVILTEATDDEKGPSRWRRNAILRALADDNGKLRPVLKRREVVRAKRILDEHQDNVYHKLSLLKLRLRILSLVSVIAVGFWIAWPPFSPAFTTTSQITASIIPGRKLWLAIILTGILGALVSGFLSSMGTDQSKARIPAEILATTVTFARISLAVLSSLAISIFLMSGLLNLPSPSLGILLAVAFASGFSDRLLLRALSSISS